MAPKALKRKALLEKSALAGLASVLMFAFAADPAVAQRAGGDEEEEEGQSSGTIDERTGEILNEAIEFLNMEDYASARTAMSELRMDRLSPYERSRAEQILFQIAYQSENYDEARSHLQAAIDAGGLNEQEISNLRYQIAQSYMVEERWAEGARALEDWFRTATNPNSAAYYLLAVAYYQMEDFAKALPNAERAVELAENPQESWLQLVLALYIQQERWRDAVPLLERLVSIDPGRKTYWMQLSSVYGQLEEYSEALATMQLPYSAGLLTEESEYMRLADLLMFNDVPYRGGMILEEAIAEGEVARSRQSYEKLANCWIAAREFDKAVEPLETAAGLASNGDLFVRLGEVHLQRENWGGAVSALQQALNKGGLRDTRNAQYLLGVSLFNQERYEDARTQFERAAQSQQIGDSARSYLLLIDSRIGASSDDEAAADEAATEEAPAAEDAAPAEAPAVDGEASSTEASPEESTSAEPSPGATSSP
jgi:tetratricopeptide (TPR) repeat protein